MSELFFDAPWWLWAIPAAAGVALLISGNARQNRRMLRQGFVLAALAVLIFAVSWLVDTPREKAIAGTKAIVKQVVAGDWDGFSTHFSPHTRLVVGDTIIFDKSDQIIASARLAGEQWKIQKITILHLQPSEDPRPPISVTIKVLSQHDTAGAGVLTSIWRLDWEKRPEGMRLRCVTAESVGDMPLEKVRGRVPGK